jgi:hypothetical protein
MFAAIHVASSRVSIAPLVARFVLEAGRDAWSRRKKGPTPGSLAGPHEPTSPAGLPLTTQPDSPHHASGSCSKRVLDRVARRLVCQARTDAPGEAAVGGAAPGEGRPVLEEAHDRVEAGAGRGGAGAGNAFLDFFSRKIAPRRRRTTRAPLLEKRPTPFRGLCSRLHLGPLQRVADGRSVPRAAARRAHTASVERLGDGAQALETGALHVADDGHDVGGALVGERRA